MSTPESLPVFRLVNQSLAYGSTEVLRGINLTIYKGERVALVGRSGAGKSTLLRHLRAMAPAEVSWCPQHPGLVPMLSVFHNIYSGVLQEHSLLINLVNLLHPQTPALRRVDSVVGPLGLAEMTKKPVGQLSGGQQQRVGLGRALIQNRPVFLGDEPVSAVDEYHAGELIRLVTRKYQTTVIALHDLDLALEHCSRVIGLDRGGICLDIKLAAAGSAELARLHSCFHTDDD